MKFTFGELVVMKTGSPVRPVMVIVDEAETITQHIENGKYVIRKNSPEDLISLATLMDIFAERKGDKERREAARIAYEKRKQDVARRKENKESNENRRRKT